jgi:putative DNA primase/helicase
MAPQESISSATEALARALGLRRSGNRYTGTCPACGYKNAFYVREGDSQPLVFCHACQDTEAVVTALQRRGLWRQSSSASPSIGSAPSPAPTRAGLRARELWIQASPAHGSLVEIYLRSRGIAMPIPATVRYLPQAKHSPSGMVLPAMIAAVTVWPERKPCAVHRTFLAPDGHSKAAVDTPKMTLGPCLHGAVRLAEAAEQLMIGEGIETCLAAMHATGQPAWAALSTSGMRRLLLPSHVKEVVILADADPPGEAAAKYAAERWVREGRRVRIARPPKGKDFNDVLLDRAPSISGGAT